jgi:receptor protein-tyrosine kinase
MSRVNEAMRRVEPAAGLRDDGDPRVERAPRRAPTLERFSVESAAAVSELEIVARTPVEPVAGPTAASPMSAVPLATPMARPLAASPAASNPKLIVSAAMPAALSAQYRRLGAALHELQLENGLKIVMVSSTVPQEGKSLTVANLALTLAESYHRRTLLIDADLRCPTLHEMFGVSKTPGLADVLASTGPDLPIVPISPWLSLLPAGHVAAGPLAQLTSERMQLVVHEAAAHFDWVLLDTPPISLLPDAQHVASVSEGVLLVIAAGVTPYKLVQRAIASIGAERIVGTMLNYVDDKLIDRNPDYGRYFSADVPRA